MNANDAQVVTYLTAAERQALRVMAAEKEMSTAALIRLWVREKLTEAKR